MILFSLKYPLDFISNFFLLLPVFVGAYRQKYLTSSLKGFVLVFTIRFIEESILIYLALVHKTNLEAQKLFMVVDVFVLCLVYGNIFRNNKNLFKLICILGVLVETLLLAHVFFYEQTGLSGSIMRFFMIVVALMYYNLVLSENKIRNILYHGMFWENAGLLMYAMGTFMTFLFIDYLYDSSKVSDNMFDIFWNMSQIVICIQCILSAIGMYYAKQERTNYLSQNDPVAGL